MQMVQSLKHCAHCHSLQAINKTTDWLTAMYSQARRLGQAIRGNTVQQPQVLPDGHETLEWEEQLNQQTLAEAQEEVLAAEMTGTPLNPEFGMKLRDVIIFNFLFSFMGKGSQSNACNNLGYLTLTCASTYLDLAMPSLFLQAPRG